MKKFTFTFFAILLSSLSGIALGQPACGVTVTGDFDSECAYDFKAHYTDECPNLMVACRNTRVTYTAHADAGVSVAEYLWEVYGDSLHSVSGDRMTVVWGGTGAWGMVVASVVTTAGDTCTDAARVKLIASPVASAATIPAYTVLPDGSKVIRVCKGATVEFFDRSTADGSDIAAWHWSCTQASPSSTPNYTVENIMGDDVVDFLVYNNCGCYDEEKYYIEVIEGEGLELECYGTVCEGAVVQYHAVSPACNDYRWYVEGGTLVGGQGTSSPLVQWSRTGDGYGILGLDGAGCGGEACPAMMSRRIPVISGNLTIKGDDDVCVGESVVYTLPLFGSTRYQWSVTPLTGVDTHMFTSANETRLVFTAPGTYTVECDYQCEFLGCGPYHAEPLTVTVRPAFEIVGTGKVCQGNTCSLATNPAVSATWTAYDLGGGNTVVATGSGTTFGYTFGHAGRYLVTAEDAAYCGPATFVVNVMAPPPAPTAADLDPDNRHAACLWGGLTLRGTPAEASYSLVWAPACTTATPQMHSGDSVAVHYRGEVCDVLVYNYDRELQCLSQTAYVHTVAPLAPAPLNIPQPMTVCGGSTIHWGEAEVPDQSADGVLYEWTIDQNSQHCASVLGDHLRSEITLAVSDLPPTVFNVYLTRTVCGSTTTAPLTIQIVDLSPIILTINGPDSACMGDVAQFTATGGSQYQWRNRGDYADGTPVDLEFLYSGFDTVIVTDNPYTYCTRNDKLPTAFKPIKVRPAPPVLGLQRNNGILTPYIVEVVPAPGSGYSYQWQYKAPGATAFSPLVSTDSYTGYVGSGVYQCTVTGTNGCPKVLTWDAAIDDIGTPPQWTPMSVTGAYNPCERTVTFTAPSTAPYMTWTTQYDGVFTAPVQSGYNNHIATLWVTEVGKYDARAESFAMVGPPLVGKNSVLVEVIPEISFIPQCSKIKLVNNSLYADSAKMMYISVTNTCNNSTDYIQLAAGTPSYSYVPSVTPNGVECVYTFTLTGIGTNSNVVPCVLGQAELSRRMVVFPNNFDTITITSDNAANNNYTCNNTPLGLTATLNTGGTIVSSRWNFGDGSYFEKEGNRVYHTFEEESNPYYVSVSVTDNFGCKWNSNLSLSVKSYNDYPSGYLLLDPNMECPNGISRDLTFLPPNTNYTYTWYDPRVTPVTNNNNIHPTYYDGNYKIRVVNNHNCMVEDINYVSFLHSPTASIYSKSYTYCVGETVRMSGDSGPGGTNYGYSWTVAPPSGPNLTFTTADITFQVSQAGSYTVTLTVTDPSSTCSSTTSVTVSSSLPPAAPALAIIGSPCIANAPVELHGTGYSGELHWNNGDTGATAQYYTPGMATAYYYDPAIGCPSERGSVYIERQPDLDALLTGCYLKCSQQASGFLPVYGLAEFGRPIWWRWVQGSVADSGYYTGDYIPLLLPLSYGDSYLTVGTPDTACKQTSSVLRIGEKQECDCDSVTVEYTVVPEFGGCHLFYRVYVTVCNNSTHELCITAISPQNPTNNINIVSENIVGAHIAGGACENYLIKLEATGIPPDILLVRLTDKECMSCTKDFSIALPPIAECVDPMDIDFALNQDLSSYVVGYLNFWANVNPAQDILGFWSEPPMVMDWLYDGIDLVSGMLMVDMAVLSQMADTGGEVCFYAIVCDNETVCKRKFCVKAADLYNTVLEGVDAPRWIHPKGAANHSGQAGHPTPQLVPNPTTDRVEVVSTAEVVEVVVMDMHGRRVLEPGGTTAMDVSTLASGTYIVRVRSRKGGAVDRVDYLKLVKK